MGTRTHSTKNQRIETDVISIVCARKDSDYFKTLFIALYSQTFHLGNFIPKGTIKEIGEEAYRTILLS